MDLNLVITQVRNYCIPLGGRVGGAADFETGTETIIAFTDPVTKQLVYPAAVVIPLEDDAGDDLIMDGDQQIVTETIGVIVEFDATADRRGQGGVSQVEAMKYALFSAILNWNPTPFRGARGLYYVGGELLQFDRARLFWQFRFSFDATITDADGFPISGDPLIQIRGTLQPTDPLLTAAAIPVIIDSNVG